MGRQSGWRHKPGNYKSCPNEAVTSLKSEQVTYRHEGDMAGDAQRSSLERERSVTTVTFVPWRGTERSLSRELRRVDLTLGEC